MTSSKFSRLKTGTYTGDGEASQGITGVGFQPKYVKIWRRHTAGGEATDAYESTDTIVDDHANGMAIVHRNGASPPHSSLTDAIISLDADGFTVDDQGIDAHPNKSAAVYNYMATG